MKRFYTTFRWFNLLLILVTFLAYLSPFINPKSFSWINFFGIIYPWLLFSNLFFVAFWMIAKKRYFLFSAACILLGWNHFTNFIGLSIINSSPREESISILSFNTSGFGFLAAKSKEEHLDNVQQFSKFINQKGDLDILCIQEVNSTKAQLVPDKLGFEYQHKIPYVGTAILSNFPIMNVGEIAFTTKANSCVWADIKVKDKTIRVYSLHLKSNRVSTETEQIIASGDIKEKETWSDIKGVFGKFRHNSKIRVDQAEKVRDHIQKSPHPIVLCGDFNETPQSYIYKLLSENLNDSFQQKGFGFGTTYAGSIPALRIDYILSDPSLKVLNCTIFKEKHSDHYPVLTVLEL